jgi:hypothetical protein
MKSSMLTILGILAHPMIHFFHISRIEESAKYSESYEQDQH